VQSGAIQSITCIFLLIVSAVAPAAPQALQPLAVSPDGHFLQHRDGSPFFWLADTAWLLLEKLDRAQTERYLDDRRAKGFNVIQVMLLHTAAATSSYGVPALLDNDPARPNVTPGADFSKPGEYDYWDHLDWVVDRAAERGIYVALVPVWGSVVKAKQLDEAGAPAYARFLARRYRDKSNIVWLNGGDLQGDRQRAVWVALGRTLKAEDPNHLITYHPFGRTSSADWFHGEPWLDFNMVQSGHQDYTQDTNSPRRYGEDNWRYIRDDYARRPARPVLDGEPSYENIPHGLHDTRLPYWSADDARRYAWWAVLAGACGHTYGDNAVMQFYRPGDQASYGPKSAWEQAIRDPGAGQMQYLKRLILSRPFFARIPDQSLIAGENGARYDHVIAARGADYAFVYTYTGRPFEVRMGIIAGERLRASWYSPRDGSEKPLGDYPNRGIVRFVPPGPPAPGNDWVLLLDTIHL
jgi:hypothetical protein